MSGGAFLQTLVRVFVGEAQKVTLGLDSHMRALTQEERDRMPAEWLDYGFKYVVTKAFNGEWRDASGTLCKLTVPEGLLTDGATGGVDTINSYNALVHDAGYCLPSNLTKEQVDAALDLRHRRLAAAILGGTFWDESHKRGPCILPPPTAPDDGGAAEPSFAAAAAAAASAAATADSE